MAEFEQDIQADQSSESSVYNEANLGNIASKRRVIVMDGKLMPQENDSDNLYEDFGRIFSNYSAQSDSS